MKTRTKVLILALSAILLVVTTVFATVAFLTSQVSITNTFTVGNVSITMDELEVNEYGASLGGSRIPRDGSAKTGNAYKLVPNHTYIKDPTIHVTAESEACYLFVCVQNGIEGIEAAGATTIAAQLTANGWKAVPDVDDVYYYSEGDALKSVDSTNSNPVDVPVFDNFKTATDANVGAYASAKIVITAYAIQADGFNGQSAEAVWAASGFTVPAAV